MKMGLCRVVTSDQGKEFNNHLNAELMKLLDIDHRLIIHRLELLVSTFTLMDVTLLAST